MTTFTKQSRTITSLVKQVRQVSGKIARFGIAIFGISRFGAIDQFTFSKTARPNTSLTKQGRP